MILLVLFAATLTSLNLVSGQRYVCYDQPCTADINGASKQCHKFCNEIGYTFGHCSNRTEPTEDTRDIPRRQKRQASPDLIASIIGGGKNASVTRGDSGSSNREATFKSEAAIQNWTKYGNQCQCYSCVKSLCDKYCESNEDINCLPLGQMLGINMEICGCGIDTSTSENLLEIIDTLC